MLTKKPPQQETTKTETKKTSASPYKQQQSTETSKVIIKYNVGFGNHLTIRGKGANLSWIKGISLKNIGEDEWEWGTDAKFSRLEFKILVNDHHFETGDNHLLEEGQTVTYTPIF